MRNPFKRSIDRPLKMVWEVRKQTRTSFLVGTAHFFPYSFRTSLTRLMRDADVVLLEGPLDEPNLAKVAEAGAEKADSPHLFDYLDTRTIANITDVVTPYCRDKASLVLFNVLNPWVENPVYTMVKGMKPWRAFFTIYAQFLERNGWKLSVDMEAYAVAQELNKEIVFLETIDEQIAVLESLSQDRIIDFLKRIDQWKTFTKTFATWYLNGDPDRIKANRFGFPTRHPQVIDRRDDILYERMQPYLEDGNSVVCVGVPHVIGINRMLASAGYQIDRWDPNSRGEGDNSP
jgi:uncharacterized protein YbaP (TraB family)